MWHQVSASMHSPLFVELKLALLSLLCVQLRRSCRGAVLRWTHSCAGELSAGSLERDSQISSQPVQVAAELKRVRPIEIVRPCFRPWRGGVLSLHKVVERLRLLLPPTFEGLEKVEVSSGSHCAYARRCTGSSRADAGLCSWRSLCARPVQADQQRPAAGSCGCQHCYPLHLCRRGHSRCVLATLCCLCLCTH